ncbi:MAG TPA: DUF2062 domain-containing protein [Candidatus Dormibacteraeota bacterium]|nr:DUF2062 domain-containing protein [Candidatus Dormibacteraeota bacterium]
MGALWSESDGDGETEDDRPLAALLHAIDLRRLSPYHAAAVRRVRRREQKAVPGSGLRLGVWLPENGAMREGRAKRIGEWLRVVLHTDDTPPRAALAFAIGVFIAWTPALGFHALLALAIAFLFGLNRVAVLAGTFVNNPWTIVPIYSVSAYLGSLLTGAEVSPPRLEGKSWSDLFDFFAQCRPWIVPLTMGTLVMGALSALVSFPVVLFGIRWYRGLRQAG